MFEYGQIKSGSRSPSRGVNPVPFYYPALGCHRAIQLFQHRSGSTQTIFKIRLLAFDRVVLFLKRPSHALRPHRLIDRYRPEVIGYFSLCLIFSPDLDLQAEPAVWTKTKRKIKHVISYGVVFEVNSALIRKGWSTPYPSPTTQNKAGHNTSNC
ncbi:hypothetical protein PSTG_09722 [Puccinia striiformis f. sp. tritici PST-78]|uniref:Histidinol-phosphatase n=1 Tax=Puccinia striiformis f. sp. tritici PST-78 TaxID=1165861 RepID=A0A0L0VDG2_9BASI|nr:hypothetical protein PSTG_09722 [Puccinia striiformis f. sp. tritici PST-78]